MAVAEGEERRRARRTRREEGEQRERQQPEQRASKERNQKARTQGADTEETEETASPPPRLAPHFVSSMYVALVWLEWLPMREDVRCVRTRRHAEGAAAHSRGLHAPLIVRSAVFGLRSTGSAQLSAYTVIRGRVMASRVLTACILQYGLHTADFIRRASDGARRTADGSWPSLVSGLWSLLSGLVSLFGDQRPAHMSVDGCARLL